MRASLVTKIKAKMKAKMQAEIARRLRKAGGETPNQISQPKQPGSGKKKRDKQKGTSLQAVPPALPTTKAVGSLNVELVTMPAGPLVMGLSRRDLVYCGIGFLAGAVATGVGTFFARRKKKDKGPAPE